ncbi:acyl-CoA N-acyltransferase [Fusarium flagelliforme]|uniref:Acyl-coa n-acyltransferase n=1 Tax=Fusarium flagelliforme TaxID=2675880 RepID=A0A395MC80_9HYPO|nr:acyl-CoA N-acyltransferase [Fusarium flagelliforme]KAH7196356.1 acyl-CoA N-acyltransferase [Fusarium flagelliforme]RFN45461.1 acyl-coa n-acyltransferase [Fusarium flagelliforme]
MIRIRQASSADLPWIQAIVLSSNVDSSNPLFTYCFPHRKAYPQDHAYFYFKLKLEPMIYKKHGIVLVAESSTVDPDGSERWSPVGMAEWTWGSTEGTAPPVSCLTDTWYKYYHRKYLDFRNFIIRYRFPRRDIDSAHENAFYATLSQVEDEFWRPGYPQVMQLNALYTHSEAWGKGVGSALVQWGLEIAGKAHVPAIVATVSAARFYEKLGFRHICKKRIQVEGEDDYVDMDNLIWTVPLTAKDPSS